MQTRFVQTLLLLGIFSIVAACTPQNKERFAEVVVAGPGDVIAVVAGELEAAKREKRRLIVYVGAEWCEPCQYFLGAVKSGKLPPSLGDLRFLKFDSDHDQDRLAIAGYDGEMIPRFVLPTTSGRGSEHRFEGSIKGPEAVPNIVQKLNSILD